MGVEFEKYTTVPQLEYKYFFMERMEVIQDKIYSSYSYPKFSMHITYRMYAIDDTGLWHYENKINTIIIDDYMEIAMIKAQQQDTDLLETAAVIEYVVAKIAEETTDMGTAKVL